ncbi:hypothetical protein BsWGS_14781 [Bradybaena similaris]
MTEQSDMDYNIMDEDNMSDVYFAYVAYDDPVWRKHEILTPFPPRNTTLAPKPDIFELNKQKCLVFSPLFIIIGCIMVFAALCNITVCYVYRCRSRRTASNFFVILFAVYDLFGCLVGIPLDISPLTLPLMYNVVPLCKIMECVKSWLVCCQCLTLLCVAFDCYGKICHPEADFNVRKAKVCCFFAFVLSVFMSLPAMAVFSSKPVSTSHSDVFGVNCSTHPSVVQWLRIMYYVCILGTFLVSVCGMAVLYGLIYMTWYKQRQAEETGDKMSPEKREFPKKHRFVRQDTSTQCVTDYYGDIHRLHDNHRSLHCSLLSQSNHVHLQLTSKRESSTNKQSNGEINTSFHGNRGNKTNNNNSSEAKTGKESYVGNKPNMQNRTRNKSSDRINCGSKRNDQSSHGIKSDTQRNGGSKTNNVNSSGKTHFNCGGYLGISSIQLHINNNRHVFTFTVISVLFLINMLPFVIVTALCATTTVFKNFSSDTSEIMFQFCARSYIINYVIKPLTYMFLNPNFKKETQYIFNKLKLLLQHKDVTSVGNSCKKLQRLSAVGPLRATVQSAAYRPPRSLS